MVHLDPVSCGYIAINMLWSAESCGPQKVPVILEIFANQRIGLHSLIFAIYRMSVGSFTHCAHRGSTPNKSSSFPLETNNERRTPLRAVDVHAPLLPDHVCGEWWAALGLPYAFCRVRFTLLSLCIGLSLLRLARLHCLLQPSCILPVEFGSSSRALLWGCIDTAHFHIVVLGILALSRNQESRSVLCMAASRTSIRIIFPFLLTFALKTQSHDRISSVRCVSTVA